MENTNNNAGAAVRPLRVAIFGQGNTSVVPADMLNTMRAWIQQTNGNIEFLVPDGLRFDASVHHLLSGLGMKDKTIIFGIDRVRTNKFNMREKVYKLEYIPDEQRAYILKDDGTVGVEWKDLEDVRSIFDDRKYYTFKDSQICHFADAALIAWDGSNKTVSNLITMLKVQNKPVYIFNI